MTGKEQLFATFRYLYKKVKNFLSTAQSKELLTFLFFLCLSFVFWILQSMNEESEAIYRIPIRYRNIPDDIVFINQPPDQLTFRLKDKGIILLNYSLGKTFMPIDIDVKPYLTQNKGSIRIPEQQIQSYLKKQLNVTSVLLSMSPDTIRINYSKQEEKMLPVHFEGSLVAGTQFQVGSEIRVTPDSVRVFAPGAMLDTLQYVTTDYLQMADLSDTIIHKVRLTPLRNAKMVPSAVEVFIPVEEYTEKVLTLAVTVVGVPDTLLIRTFPSLVQLSCFVSLRDFKDVVPESFQVSVEYDQITQSGSLRIPVEVIQAPGFVTNVRCKPDSVEYIIEEKE